MCEPKTSISNLDELVKSEKNIGVRKFIEKPFDKGNLAVSVREVLDEKVL